METKLTNHDLKKLQLTNHGVSEELMQDVLVVGKEFFDLPVKEERFYSEDPNRTCQLRTSINYDEEKVHFWRDNFRHPCHPLEDYIHEWPQNPARYRYDHITLPKFFVSN